MNWLLCMVKPRGNEWKAVIMIIPGFTGQKWVKPWKKWTAIFLVQIRTGYLLNANSTRHRGPRAFKTQTKTHSNQLHGEPADWMWHKNKTSWTFVNGMEVVIEWDISGLAEKWTEYLQEYEPEVKVLTYSLLSMRLTHHATEHCLHLSIINNREPWQLSWYSD